MGIPVPSTENNKERFFLQWTVIQTSIRLRNGNPLSQVLSNIFMCKLQEEVNPVVYPASRASLNLLRGETKEGESAEVV